MELSDPLLNTLFDLISIACSRARRTIPAHAFREEVVELLEEVGFPDFRINALYQEFQDRLGDQDVAKIEDRFCKSVTSLSLSEKEFLSLEATSWLLYRLPDNAISATEFLQTDLQWLFDRLNVSITLAEAAFDCETSAGRAGYISRILLASLISESIPVSHSHIVFKSSSGNLFLRKNRKNAPSQFRAIRSGKLIPAGNRFISASDLAIYFSLQDETSTQCPETFYLAIANDEVAVSLTPPAEEKYLCIERQGLQFSCRIVDSSARAKPSGGEKQLLLSDVLRIGRHKTSLRRLIQLFCQGSLIETLHVRNLTKKFRGGDFAIDNVSFSAQFGRLIGILGPSGSGKSTLLNLLSGQNVSDSSAITVNGLPLNSYLEKRSIGVVPQDDILHPNLTVRETLQFGQSLRSKVASDSIPGDQVERVLEEIDLKDKADLPVGSFTSKTLSGGQRKRVNLGLEFLTDPELCLLDEPTSGLSSADARHVVELLRNRADKGALIFVVLHQPGQEILSAIDQLLILDQGGKLAYFGDTNAVDEFFRSKSQRPRHEYASTSNFVFDTLEQKQLGIDGSESDHRRYPPSFWQANFERHSKPEMLLRRQTSDSVDRLKTNPDCAKPTAVLWTLLRREFTNRLRQRSQLGIALASSIFLGLIAGLSCRYSGGGNLHEAYSYSKNEALLNFSFLTVIIALFFAISGGINEIVRDRDTRLRERSLKISDLSYLLSKWLPIHLVTTTQILLYLLISFAVLEIPDTLGLWWLFLVGPVASAGVGLGLLVSSLPGMSERAATAAIPILLIPQIILSGAEPFPFSKMQHLRIIPISSTEPTEESPPLFAQLSLSRWAMEGIVTLHRDHSFTGKRDRAEKRLTEGVPSYGSLRTILRQLDSDTPDFHLAKQAFQEKFNTELTESKLDDYALIKGSQATQESFSDLPSWIRERTSPSAQLISASFSPSRIDHFPTDRTLPLSDHRVSNTAYSSFALGIFFLIFFTSCLTFLVFERNGTIHWFRKSNS